MSNPHRPSGHHDRHRHPLNGESGNSLPDPVRKSIAVRMDVFRLLHTLQINTEPRIDLSYLASAAIEHAFGSPDGEAAIRNLALGLMRRDLDQFS